LITHKAGQYLPIRVLPPGEDAPIIRTYTLSVAPSDNAYRISVKLDGKVSQHLHRLSVGDILQARAPAGVFTIDALQPRPAVLLAAGVGITPILAMLRHLVYEGLRKQRVRKTWIFYSAHAKADRAFHDEIATLARTAGGAVNVVRVLSNVDGAVKDIDFDESGRITTELLKQSLPLDDYEFYLCGPSGFMQDTYSGLRALNIADSRIHAESFGPAGIRRTPDDPQVATNRPHPATKSVPVIFVDSAKEARWTPESGSLLDLAESRGLSPEYSCRSGSCGTCKVKILKGTVAYKEPPLAHVDADEALICSAFPAEQGNEDAGGLQLAL
jgi:ferredoxin-NADP reductase